MIQRTLDWRPHHDPQSHQYPIQLPPANQPRPTSIYWGNPTITLDQGQEGACVGYAWTNNLLSLPNKTQLTQTQATTFARQLYHQAQQNDEWPGENYSGTSVLAAAKILKTQGHITQYRWAFNINQILDALAYNGPIVLGIPWYQSMYQTTPEALVTVDGNKVGGHAITATGYGTRTFKYSTKPGAKPTHPLDVIRWRNSWGPTYGNNGDAYITIEDLAQVLKENGEACVPTKK